MHLDGGRRVERGNAIGRGLRLAAADIGGGVDGLAREVARLDDVVVDDAERADSGRGERGDDRAAEPAGADHEHAGGREPRLRLRAEARQHEAARVPLVIHG